MRMRWLGPGIVIGGAAIAAVAIWYYVHARPEAGDLVAAYPIDHGQTVLVRAEKGGDRSFVELHDADKLLWQALVPHYVGTQDRSGIAWSDMAISVRVDRDGRAEVFHLGRQGAQKLGGFRLAPDHEPVTTEPSGPITLTDHIRSYEIVGGDGWHRIVAVDLRTGRPLWQDEIGKAPVQAGSVHGSDLSIVQGNRERVFDVFTGVEDKSRETANPL